MRLVVVCGYDGNECKKLKVKLDDDGNIIYPDMKDCTYAECECYFMGSPWVRVEVQKGE